SPLGLQPPARRIWPWRWYLAENIRSGEEYVQARPEKKRKHREYSAAMRKSNLPGQSGTSEPAVGSLRTKISPRTSTSIFVRRKHAIASSGRQTMGSLSLNEVFRTTGTPVRLPNPRISRQ